MVHLQMGYTTRPQPVTHALSARSLRPSHKATARSRGGGSCAACHGMRVAGVLVDRMGCSDDEVLDGSVCAGATCVLPGDACGNVGNRKRYQLPVTEC